MISYGSDATLSWTSGSVVINACMSPTTGVCFLFSDNEANVFSCTIVCISAGEAIEVSNGSGHFGKIDGYFDFL